MHYQIKPVRGVRPIANKIYRPNAGSMLGQRRRRWSNIEPALGTHNGTTLNKHWASVSCQQGWWTGMFFGT